MSFDSGLTPSEQLNAQNARMFYTDVGSDTVRFWDGAEEHALKLDLTAFSDMSVAIEEMASAMVEFARGHKVGGFPFLDYPSSDFSPRGINKAQGKKGLRRRNRKHRRR